MMDQPWVQVLRLWSAIGMASATGLAGCAGGGAGDDAPGPSTESTSVGSEAPAAEPQEMTEGDALNVAIALVEAEGYDIVEYDDIVVHTNESGDFEVQLRKPRINRFLFVTVDRDTREGVLEIRNAQAQ